VLLVSLCRPNVAAAAAAYSASAKTSSAVTAGAEMSQRRKVPAPKRLAPRWWRANGGAETAAPKCPAPLHLALGFHVFIVVAVVVMVCGRHDIGPFVAAPPVCCTVRSGIM